MVVVGTVEIEEEGMLEEDFTSEVDLVAVVGEASVVAIAIGDIFEYTYFSSLFFI